MSERHYTEVLGESARGESFPRVWAARCSCGWCGRTYPRKRDAENDADEHVNIMADGR